MDTICDVAVDLSVDPADSAALAPASVEFLQSIGILPYECLSIVILRFRMGSWVLGCICWLVETGQGLLGNSLFIESEPSECRL